MKNIGDDDEAIWRLVCQANVNSHGQRPGSNSYPSASSIFFGDPYCEACKRMQSQGGCEAHKKSAAETANVPVAPAPYRGKKAERDLYFDPAEVDKPSASLTRVPFGFSVDPTKGGCDDVPKPDDVPVKRKKKRTAPVNKGS